MAGPPRARISAALPLSVPTSPMPGACMTCTGTSGNGAVTGKTGMSARCLKKTRMGPITARYEVRAGARGATQAGIAVLPAEAVLIQSRVIPMLVSASPAPPLSSQDFEYQTDGGGRRHNDEQEPSKLQRFPAERLDEDLAVAHAAGPGDGGDALGHAVDAVVG